MGKGSVRAGLRASFGIVLASALLVLGAPGVALAANTATFSAAAPKAGSVSTVTLPKVSVTVYDRYGVKGSTKYSMYIDGVKVTPTLTRISGYGLRKFKLTYAVKTPLSIDSHTVKVYIRDLAGKRSSYSWSFMVDSPTPPAVFSALTPSDGSVTDDNRSTVSAAVVERWDVTGYSMTIDGEPVGAVLRSATPGDMKNLVVSFDPATPLAQGPHEVTISVTDVAKRTTSTTWSFTVWAEMPLSITGADCGACHTGYPSAHPMSNCAGCHGAGSPPRGAEGLYPGAPMSVYGPSDVSAHTPSCASEAVCHGGEADFPHVLGTDCSRCHNASYPTIPQGHAPLTPEVHLSDGGFCTQEACHSTSLTLEHYKYTTSDLRPKLLEEGTPLDCATCHQSGDERVRSAIAEGVTACVACHTLDAGPHPGTESAHALPVRDCTMSGCHGDSDLAALHGGLTGSCLVCHDGATAATSDCTSSGCHLAQPHTGLELIHTNADPITCTGLDCHGTNAITIHTAVGGPGCPACHAPTAVTTLDCATCHPGGEAVAHEDGDLPHGSNQGACGLTACHSSNLTVIHEPTESNCNACHGVDKTPSTTCADCHAGPYHTFASKAHALTDANCTFSECHTTDVSVIHSGTDPDCAACHGQTAPATKTCATCHDASPHAAIPAHDVSASTCVSSACHESVASAIHTTAPAGCGSCHGLGTPATALCATCHTGDGAPAHGTIGTSHTAGNLCVASGCHVTDISSIHAETASTCQACHADGVTPSADCSTCHFAMLVPEHPAPAVAHTSASGCINADCHVADVTSIHAVTDSKCQACHAPGVTPSLDCATCHEPAHTAQAGVHTSATTSCTRASGCHTANVTAIHGASCFACHAEGVVPTTACLACHTTAHSAETASHVVTESCAPTCHAGTATSIHNSQCSPCHFQTYEASLTCSDCHEPHTDLPEHQVTGACADCHGVDVSVIHEDAKNGCKSCHNGGTLTTLCVTCHPEPHDLDALHASTPASETVTIDEVVYGPLACSSCHAADLRPIHGGDESCGTCHPTAFRALVDPWTRGCVQDACHAPAGTRPMHTDATAAHETTEGVTIRCGGDGCHGDVTSLATIHSATTRSCEACHNGAPLKADCAACHDAHDIPGIHAATLTSDTFTINGASYGSRDCSDCHFSADLTVVHGGAESCGVCHPTAAAAIKLEGAWDRGCIQADCHAGGSTTPYHAQTDPAHVATDGPVAACGGSDCHGLTIDLAAVHAGSASSCNACHAEGKTPSGDCSACHGTHDLPALHAATPGDANLTVGGGYDYGTHACDECHASLDLRTLHTDSCSWCHDPHVADLLGAAWTNGCAQGDCHKVGTEFQTHLAINTSHETTPGVTAACGTATCHGDVSNAAAVHAGTTRGCTACHDGDPLTIECASCHPPHDLEGAHAASLEYPTLITDGGPVYYGTHYCNECHAPSDYRPLHGGDSGCGTCHPTAVAAVSTPMEGGCVAFDCHTTGSTAPMHAGLTAAHETTAGVTTACGGGGICHTDVSNLAVIHANTDGIGGCARCHNGDPLTGVCADCHAPHDVPAAHASTETTAAFEILTSDFGIHTCTECHSLDLRTNHGGEVGCTTCHPTPAGPMTSWDGTCSQALCHAPGVPAMAMHTTLDSDHGVSDGSLDLCGGAGCHSFTGNVALIHNNSASKCAACHDGRAVLTKVCTDCHDLSAHAGHASTVTEGTFEIAGANYGTYACATCHATMELQAAHGELGGKESCAKCHPTPSDSVTNRAGGCAVGNCHAGTSPIPMHDTFDTAHFVSGPVTCVKGGCHGGNLMTLHSGAPLGCVSCHNGSPLTAVCTDCHTDPVESTDLHPTVVTDHTTGGTGCTIGGGCHGTDVRALHAPSVSQCNACHANGKPTLTLVCTTAGCHDTGDPHPAHPTAPANEAIAINGTSYGTHACSECHANDLKDLHGGGTASCVNCHPSPRDSFTVYNDGCVQGACHDPAGGLKQHLAINASHTDNVTAPTCVTGAPGCHLSSSSTDVAGIHAAAGSPSCAACHGGGKVPTLVCATALCHDTGDAHPAANPHPGMPAGHTTGLPSTCVRAGCHIASLDMLHAGAVGDPCAMCHGTDGVGGTKTKDCQNAACHPYAVDSLTLHPDYNTFHDTGANGCTGAQCHPATALTIHGRTDCYNSCHKASPALTLTCATCHAGVSGAQHTALHDYCSGCHSSHNSSYGTGAGSIPGAHSCVEAACHPSPGSAGAYQPGQPHGWDYGCDNCH